MDCHFVRHHRATSKDKNVKSLPDTAATTKAGSSWTLSWNLKVPNPVSSDINKNRGCEVWRVGSWWLKGSNIEEDMCTVYIHVYTVQECITETCWLEVFIAVCQVSVCHPKVGARRLRAFRNRVLFRGVVAIAASKPNLHSVLLDLMTWWRRGSILR